MKTLRTVQGLSNFRVIGLTKTFQEGDHRRKVLDELSFEIRKGEFIVLLGRSGSGKSTLLNLISGIDLPTSGDVYVGETNLTRLSERERTLFRRQHIGFIFQSFNLISTLTVAENVLLPLELNGRMGENELHQVDQLLQEIGLGDRASSYPDRLSGGEQQRVAIARALVHRPTLILADEPTGNLDYTTGKQVVQLLNRLVRQEGQTMILVTHETELTTLADRVLILEQSKIKEQKWTTGDRAIG